MVWVLGLTSRSDLLALFLYFGLEFIKFSWKKGDYYDPPNVVHCSQNEKWVRAMYIKGFEDYFKN